MKEKMIEAIKASLEQRGALNLGDDELARCLLPKVAGVAMLRYAKQFRDEGIDFLDFYDEDSDG